jgi:hypothetical protein
VIPKSDNFFWGSSSLAWEDISMVIKFLPSFLIHFRYSQNGIAAESTIIPPPVPTAT